MYVYLRRILAATQANGPLFPILLYPRFRMKASVTRVKCPNKAFSAVSESRKIGPVWSFVPCRSDPTMFPVLQENATR